MKPEKMRILIAEACGWKKVARPKPEDEMQEQGFAWLKREYWDAKYLPDYPNDLNAMNEAEKIMNPHQLGHYMGHLQHAIARHSDPNFPKIHAGIFYWHATAQQRAEAFLRTIGKWKE